MNLYYKNKELAEKYGVSRQAVSKWVESVKKGKLHLDMIDVNGQSYICNTPKNNLQIEGMVQERKKYMNSRSLKTISPKPEFYELFMDEQIADIITQIRVHHEIPRQYNYFDAGAQYWDAYASRLFYDTETHNPYNETEHLLQLSMSYLDKLLSPYSQINIIDIGPGNALPSKSLVEHLIKQNKMGRYHAIDISPEMLALAARNIKEWFGNTVKIETDLRDVNYERFSDLLMSSSSDDGSVNVVLFLGGTLHNLRSTDEALRTIYHSMSSPDILICPLKLDNKATRNNFHFMHNVETQQLPVQHKFLVDLLNIDPSLYDVEMGFNEKIRARYLQLRLKVAIDLKLQLKDATHIIELDKDDTLLVWRYWHQTALEMMNMFERNGFALLQTNQTAAHDWMLTICDIKPEH